MFQLNPSDRKYCELRLSKLRTQKTQKDMVVYFVSLGVPKATARFMVKRLFGKKQRDVRCYCLPKRNFIFVDYDFGQVVVGDEDEVVDAIAEKHSWQQGLLWIEMAEHAARGRRMAYREIRDFIYDVEPTEILQTKNVAPLEVIGRRRRTKARRPRRGILEFPDDFLL